MKLLFRDEQGRKAARAVMSILQHQHIHRRWYQQPAADQSVTGGFGRLRPDRLLEAAANERRIRRQVKQHLMLSPKITVTITEVFAKFSVKADSNKHLYTVARIMASRRSPPTWEERHVRLKRDCNASKPEISSGYSSPKSSFSLQNRLPSFANVE